MRPILPLLLALGSVLPASQQPRDPRPADVSRAAADERAKTEQAMESAIAAFPDKLDLRFKLAKFQETGGKYEAAEATLLAARQAFNTSAEPLTQLAAFYTRVGNFEKAIAALEQIEQMEPQNREHPQRIAVAYWEKAFRDPNATPDQKRRYIQAGLAATDRALAIDSAYAEAMVYKNILLRLQARLETDPAQQQQLIAQADELRARAIELRPSTGAPPVGAAGAPPPPPPPSGDMAPVRVGGNVAPPTKILDVKPVYPPDAYASKVQGVVIIEARIDPAGMVDQARVLRSIPLLDQAAVDAVRQWQFTPTYVNGQAVPVIMTVTVNFTLQ